MIIKITFKSHFKIKKNFKKNKNKSIFVKNIVVLLFFSKIFFKNCVVSLLFLNKKAHKVSLLRAPSRHKKFFHQIFLETFLLKLFLRYNYTNNITSKNGLHIFKGLNSSVLLKMGTNTLSRSKLLLGLTIKEEFNFLS